MTDTSLERDLGRLEGKLDALISTVTTDISDRKERDRGFDTKIASQDKRITKIENRLHYYAGGIAVLSFGLSHLDWFISLIR